ncbi:multidrug transporter subunit MdtC [Herbaspirillum sp. HC18]|nr:multidrug transporter subunit MdtC [Herbaspirillum sp. HC18]
MNLSLPFIRRPVATTLLTLGIVVAGVLSWLMLPIAPLPRVDFPTIMVTATLPGASPETMAATVATPLERTLGSIAGVTEMTSASSLGTSRITLQFDLDRDIDGAARDVQAAINASRALLPGDMPNNPTYRKVNPAEGPVMVIALTSATLGLAAMYDAASTVLAQRLAQVEGIGQVTIGGGALPAVRIAVDPDRLAASGLSMEEVRSIVVTANLERPKGVVEYGDRSWQVGANDRAERAEDFAPLILTYRSGAALRLKDVADVTDSVQDVRNHGVSNGRPAVLLVLSKAPGANVVEAVDRVRALLPTLRASIPEAIDMNVVIDRTPTIRASIKEVRHALMLAVVLVILVVFAFLRSARAALMPTVAVPAALAGTFAVMFLLGFSINNLSLMAMTVAAGFVVDDAIVVVENIARHIERGKTVMQAVVDGTSEIAFTVVAISIALIAAFIPILFMGGIVGRLFREFAIVLAAAIVVSMLVSMTTTPMMAALLMRRPAPKRADTRRMAQMLGAGQAVLWRAYRRTLRWTLRRQPLALALLVGVMALAATLYVRMPKGFFPQQDTGRLVGVLRADQSNSFQAMRAKLDAAMAMVQEDPAVESVTGFTGGSQRNTANMFISLKSRSERGVSADQVVSRLRARMLGASGLAGATLYLVPTQDVRVGARQSNAQYQFTLQTDTIEELRNWEPRIRRAMMASPLLADVNSDQQDRGLQTTLKIDRDAAARLGVSVSAIDSTLNNAFGQRQIRVIYNPLNQYRVVLELAPEHLQDPATLKRLMVKSATRAEVPLLAVARPVPSVAALIVNHQAGSPAATISFNLPEGVALSEAAAAVTEAMADLGIPPTVRTSFQGTASAFQASLQTMPLLLLAAVVTIYLVLGMLYESLVHPLTILSTLPSAGVGALLALMAFDIPFTLIALIGVILLIGIVMKNAIMMIDFAITRQRHGCSAGAAIYRAGLLRVRPILMTTLAALFGALPLALPALFGGGDGAELRQPLGVAVVGGLVLSQWLTLYTTPVVFLVLDRLRRQRPAPTALTLGTIQ